MKHFYNKTLFFKITSSLIVLVLSINTSWAQWSFVGNTGYHIEMYSDGYGYRIVDSLTNQPPGGSKSLILRTLDDWVTSDSVTLILPKTGCCQVLDFYFNDTLNGIVLYIDNGDIKAKLLNNGTWSTLNNDVGWHSYVSNYIFLDSSLLVGMTFFSNTNLYILKRDYNSNSSTPLHSFNSNQYQILKIDMDKDGNFYTLLSNIQNNERFLAISKDTAQTFNYLFSNATTPFKSVNFIDSLNGYLRTNSGEIYFSNDGGNTWNYQSNPIQNINAIKFKNDSTIFLGGDSGKIYISEDYGASWRIDSIPSAANISNIFLVDSINVYVSDWNGNLYKNNISTIIQGTKSADFRFFVFPNPSSDYIHVKLNQSLKFKEYRIYSLTGKLVQKGRNQQRIDIRGIKEGTYIFQILDGKNQGVKKIIIRP